MAELSNVRVGRITSSEIVALTKNGHIYRDWETIF